MPMVLVVDDTEVDRRLMAGMLEINMEWLVTFANNGKEALEIINQAVPDVVVTDLEMPEMDGLQLVEACRQHFSSVPVILVTGKGSEVLAMTALRHGATSYVPKSHLADNLLPTVEQVMALKAAERSHDRLIQCTTNTRYKFQLDNDPSLIAPLVDRVQRVMIGMKLLSPNERLHLGVALEEALINALYHGNLELPAEELVETRKCLHEGKSCPLIEDRRQEAPYCDRKILVGVDLTHEQAQFVVRDQGQGFDTSSLPDVGSADALTADGGRGLVLIRTFMDEVTFAEGGREIRMILRRKK